MHLVPSSSGLYPTMQSERTQVGGVAASSVEAQLDFKDIVDTVNPLQQLPVVGSIYRAMTGDSISTASRLAGGALMGGPIGFLAALANEIVQGETGKDIGGNLIAMLTGGDEETQLSDNSYTQSPGMYRASTNAYVKSQSLLA
jgi:hypothetical protein